MIIFNTLFVNLILKRKNVLQGPTHKDNFSEMLVNKRKFIINSLINIDAKRDSTNDINKVIVHNMKFIIINIKI